LTDQEGNDEQDQCGEQDAPAFTQAERRAGVEDQVEA